MTDARTFGAWLQRERERRDITLRAIADRTKIGVALLQSLERGDVSRWPGGIYRRSFVRSYAEAIGVDADLVLANFERLFPDPEALSGFDRLDVVPSAPRASGDAGGMRLQFASPVWPGAAAMRTAGLDVVLAMCVGAVGWFAAGAIGFWCALAIAALACHLCTVLGLRWAVRAPVASAILHWRSRRARAREMAAELADYPENQPDPALDLTYYAR
jgi:transcriptional regulator with XRE-family HTH domain